MEKREVSSKRVLARRLAKELNDKELLAVGGRGTSYAGSGGCVGGLGADVTSVDCCDGPDRFAC
jgi:hypothetical protein